MAITIQKAIEAVTNKDFESYDLQELYKVLESDGNHPALLTELLKEIKTKAEQEFAQINALTQSAQFVKEYSKSEEIYDRSNPAYKESWELLDNFYYTYEKKDVEGDLVTHEWVNAGARNVQNRIVDAANLRTMSALRGSDKDLAKKFREARNEADRKKIYEAALKDAISTAVYTIAISEDANKLCKDLALEGRTLEEIETTLEASGRDVNADVKEKIKKIMSGEGGELTENDTINYCTGSMVVAQDDLEASKKEFAEKAKFLDFASKIIPDSDVAQSWKSQKFGISKDNIDCHKDTKATINKVTNAAKKLWGNRVDISKAVWKGIKENKLKIARNMSASGGLIAISAFDLTGTTALLLTGAYVVNTVYDRVSGVIKEERKKNPEVTFKQIIKKPRNIAKIGAGVLIAGVGGAAGCSMAGYGQIFGGVGQTLATSPLARSMSTTAISSLGNVVGIATAEDKQDKVSDSIGLAFSLSAGGLAMLLRGTDNSIKQEVGKAVSSTIIDDKVSDNPVIITDSTAIAEKVRDTLNGLRLDSLTKDGVDSTKVSGLRDTLKVNVADSTKVSGLRDTLNSNVADTPAVSGEEVTGNADNFATAFPTKYSKDMGISMEQFINLKKIILKNGDDNLLNTLYYNASRYASALSMDANNPLTAEEVLFKFTRAGAWTTKMDADFWSSSATGIYGEEIDGLKFLLSGCSKEVLDAKNLDSAKAVLASIRPNGSIDFDKMVEIDPTAAKYNARAEDGSLVGTTRNVLVGYAEVPCDDKGDTFEFASVPAPTPTHTPTPTPVPVLADTPVTRVATPPLLNLTRVPFPALEVPPLPTPKIVIEGDSYINGYTSFSDEPAAETLGKMGASSTFEPMTGAQISQAKKDLKDALESGVITSSQYQDMIDGLHKGSNGNQGVAINTGTRASVDTSVGAMGENSTVATRTNVSSSPAKEGLNAMNNAPQQMTNRQIKVATKTLKSLLESGQIDQAEYDRKIAAMTISQNYARTTYSSAGR